MGNDAHSGGGVRVLIDPGAGPDIYLINSTATGEAGK